MKQNKKYEPEIDFMELLKNPKRLFGWVFPYFLIVILLLGIFYVKNLNAISDNTAQVNAPVKDEIKRSIMAKKGAVMPPVDLDVITNPSSEFIARGKELYQQNCASCHGNSGMGDGVAGAALNPAPRNFENLEGWTNETNFIGLYKTLEEGIVKNGMAAYEFLPPIDRIAMLQYIRTFGDYPEITNDQIQEVDLTYSLTEGKATSNQIPVEDAIEKLLKEKPAAGKISNVLAYVNSNSNLVGAEVFKRVVINNYRVLSSFSTSEINRINIDEFITIVSTNFNEIGFSADVNLLQRSEWQSLFNFMKNVIGAVEV